MIIKQSFCLLFNRKIRDRRANYQQSLDVLQHAKQAKEDLITKTSIMLGFGETDDMIKSTMEGTYYLSFVIVWKVCSLPLHQKGFGSPQQAGNKKIPQFMAFCRLWALFLTLPPKICLNSKSATCLFS